MQAKHYITKFSSKFPSWKTLEGSDIQIAYSNKNPEIFIGQTDVGNEERDLRYKNLLPWQNILNNKKIAADMEETSTKQGSVLQGRMETMPQSHQQSVT